MEEGEIRAMEGKDGTAGAKAEALMGWSPVRIPIGIAA